MNNLKPNMYIRTKEGKIDKVLEINIEDFDEPAVRLASYPLGMYQGMFEYKKASHNIGEILEAGDFLDFHCIEKIEGTTIYLTDGWFVDFEDVEDMVETICTKECFESMSYKVGE